MNTKNLRCGSRFQSRDICIDAEISRVRRRITAITSDKETASVQCDECFYDYYAYTSRKICTHVMYVQYKYTGIKISKICIQYCTFRNYHHITTLTFFLPFPKQRENEEGAREKEVFFSTDDKEDFERSCSVWWNGKLIRPKFD